MLWRAILMLLLAFVAGCNQSAIDQNRQLLEQQQAEIDQMKKQMAALNAPQYTPTPPPGRGCDRAVMAEATKRGGDRFAVNDFSRALGYYQDALTACPGNPRAELNLARTLDAMGNRAAALPHYQAAAASTDPAESDAESQARLALSNAKSN